MEAHPSGHFPEKISIKPVHECKRHPKETEEQFSKRQILNHKELSAKQSKEAMQVSTETRVSRLLLRKMFKKRANRMFRLKCLPAMFILRKFLRFCVRLYRTEKAHNASTMINRMTRGFLARQKIPGLLDGTIITAAKKLWAVIRIRNVLRASARDMSSSPWFKPKWETEEAKKENLFCGAFLAKIALLRHTKALGTHQLKLGSSQSLAVPGRLSGSPDSGQEILRQNSDSAFFSEKNSKDKPARLSFTSGFSLNRAKSGTNQEKGKAPMSSAASSAARMLGSFLLSKPKSAQAAPGDTAKELSRRDASPSSSQHGPTAEKGLQRPDAIHSVTASAYFVFQVAKLFYVCSHVICVPPGVDA